MQKKWPTKCKKQDAQLIEHKTSNLKGILVL